MDAQMVKLLKNIRKSKGQVFYDELCQNPLSEDSLRKLLNQGYASISPVNVYGEPQPETKVYITPEGENFLIDQRSLAIKENIARIVVPIIIGVLCYIASKLIDIWLL